ncbi:MAG: small multi-drug export protein [Desulfurococcaceae archaeon]
MESLSMILIILMALTPISEVRGAIPLVFAIFNDGFHVIWGIMLSVLSNMMVPFIAYFVLDMLDYLIRSKYSPSFIKRIYNALLNFGKRRARRLRKESYIGLTIFVGVPLPFTGAWTGTLVAYVLGLDRRKTIISIELGVLIATIIVIIVSYTGVEFLKKIFLAQ